MLKGKQAFMGLETHENEATRTHVCRNKANKNQGFWVTASCMLEQVCVRMSSTCVRRLYHVYANPYPENLIYTKTEKKPNKT